MAAPDPTRPAAPPRAARHVWLQAAPAALALILGLYHWTAAASMNPDGVIFLRYARQMAGEWGDGPPAAPLDVVREQHQHPGYPLMVWAVRAAAGPLLPDDPVRRWELAGRLVNLIGGVWLVIAAGALGRTLLGAGGGLAAGLIAAVSPSFAPVRADVTSDPAALALLLWSAVYGARCLAFGGMRDAFLCGLMGGLGYLVRPEEIQAAAVTCLMLAARAAFGSADRSRAAIACAAAVAPALALCVPYVVLKGSPLTKKAHLLSQPPAAMAEVALALAAEELPIPAAFASADEDEPTPRPRPLITSLATGYGLFGRLYARPLGWVFLPHVLYGAWRRRRLIGRRPGIAMVWACVFVNALVLPPALHVGVGHMDARHVLPSSVLTLAFVWPGLTGFAALCFRRMVPAAAGGLACGAAALAFVAARPLNADWTGHRLAGEWLAGRVPAGAEIIDPIMLAGHYAGLDPVNAWDRYPIVTHKHLDHLVGDHPAAVYLIVGDGRASDYALPEPVTGALGGRPVREEISFPLGAGDERRVRVYRLSAAGP